MICLMVRLIWVMYAVWYCVTIVLFGLRIYGMLCDQTVSIMKTNDLFKNYMNFGKLVSILFIRSITCWGIYSIVEMVLH